MLAVYGRYVGVIANGFDEYDHPGFQLLCQCKAC
jgi:hypothetical protein